MKNNLLLLTAGFAGFMSSCESTKKLPEQPNIIFIMSDDHAYQALSCYGGTINKTPNLDRIANEGMLFENSFVTNSISAPSRAVLLTGKLSHLNGQITNGNSFDGSQLTFPKLLQEAGYQTAIVGKWHLRSDPTGFDYWNILPGQGDYYNPDFIEMGERKNHEGYVTNLITDFTIDWLENRDMEKPFTLLYHHKAPHRSWMPDTTDLHLYDDVIFPLPENYWDDYEGRGRAAAEQKMRIDEVMSDCMDLKLCGDLSESELSGSNKNWMRVYGKMTDKQRIAWNLAYKPKNDAMKEAGLSEKELSEWKFQRYMHDYLRCIHSVDKNVGRLLDYLEENGLSENTVVIYTSDQGFYLGEHGWFDKRFMYEESHKMPLMIKYPPLIEKGSSNKYMVMNLDFAPTILDLAGVAIPKEMQGESLLPVLKGENPDDWRKEVYYHYFEYPGAHSVKRHYGIRTDNYKLIHFYFDADYWELYDIKSDPSEMNNLINDPSYDSILLELKQRLYELKDHYGDTPELEQKYLPERMKK